MRRFWKGASLGLGALMVAFLFFVAYARVAPPTPSLGAFLAVLKLTAQLGLAGLAVLISIRLLARIPSSYLFTLACSIVLLVYFFGRFKPWGVFWTLLLAVVPVTVLGGGLAIRKRSESRTLWIALPLATGALIYVLYEFFRPGFAVEPPPNAALASDANVQSIDLPNPGEAGAYAVRSTTYGSGRDRHRPEFGDAVDLVTEPVDGSAFIEGWEKRSGWARTRYWGFDAKELPIQGRVWYPDGDGPFPLVLIVHGNHAMEDFSDPGYAYLGELLASRGIVFVSVDENFINSSFSGRLDGLLGRGLETENDARGWLLLKHLEQWRTWNDTAGHAFSGRIDLERLALIGHSRGGEAVAVAAAFNTLSHYPDDASQQFDFGFNLRGIVAIAPVDGQYKPSGRGTPLIDVNYFVLHGSHDGDVQSFAGSRQFERVEFTGGRFRFKSSLYIYGANHGQFNTTWGRTDSSFPFKNVLNLTPILPEADQRQIAGVYISAFLEAVLRDERGYLPLFEDARTGGDWLPDTIYLTHYEDSTHVVVCDFEDDLDLTTASLDGATIASRGFTEWREALVELKSGDKATRAAHLRWDRDEVDEIPTYTVSLPPGLELTSGHELSFTLAAVQADGEEGEPVDVTIELVDASGVAARVPLSRFSLLQPAVEVQVRKSDLFNRTKKTEPVFQSFIFPLAAFVDGTPELDPARLQRIEWRFDVTPKGSVILDNVSFRPARSVQP